MKIVFKIILFLVGVINFLPSLLTFVPSKISESYGVSTFDVNLELLLRHRAIMFGIIGGFMLYSSIVGKHQLLAIIMGLISMISFIVLYYSIGAINPELTKVMMIDLIATIGLVVGLVIYLLKIQ